VANSSYSINTRWYLDVNQLARQSFWAHGVMEIYSHYLGIAVLVLILLAAWFRSRGSSTPARTVAGVLWAAGGTVVAWILAHYWLKPLVAERRPYLALHHVEVLLTRTHGYSFPSGHATIAGAVIMGLLLARRRLAFALATVFGLLLCFGRIYTGMHYPFDVLGGLVFGALVVAVLWPVAVALLTRFDQLLLATPLAPLVAAGDRSKHQPGTSSTRVPTASEQQEPGAIPVEDPEP
jgi:membrane-associated phospholipid phosphatase